MNDSGSENLQTDVGAGDVGGANDQTVSLETAAIPSQEAAPVVRVHESEGRRQRALQEELGELVDVVGPGPLVDLLLERAFQMQATDLHLDPMEDGLRVRLRVDGLLHDVLMLPLNMVGHVVSRIKLMANMNITEKRFSQDGHIANMMGDSRRDVRVGSGPTINGERIVLRLMPDSNTFTKLDDLGFDDWQVEKVEKFIKSPYGMFLSVGPVGAGKTTTMYACLESMNTPDRSLATIEDPVERRIKGANQIQVDRRINFGFIEALRGVLRQDPNVMMIGEIRDPETAHIGVRAGMTGITVMSTLHANDTASTIDVFREFDVAPMFIAESLLGIISQRLLRKICENCRTTYEPDESTRRYLGVDPDDPNFELARGVGCDNCFNTGYHGRTGVFEVMAVEGDVRDAIIRDRPQREVLEAALSQGMERLEDHARRRVRDGQTTIEEVHRVLTVEG